MSPDWLGSPQHFVAGLALTLAAAVWARRRLSAAWQVAGLALAITMAAEALVELAEYPLLYGHDATLPAYYDTIADIGATFAGAILGTLIGLALRNRSATRARTLD